MATAERLYRELIARWPAAPQPHHRLGVLYARTGRARQGARHIAKAAQLSPQNATYATHLGQAYLAAGQGRDAIAAFRNATRLRPTSEAHFNLGNALRQSGRGPEAISSYRAAIEADPAMVPPYIHLGVSLQEGGAHPEAIDAFRRALAVEPRSCEAQYNLGTSYAALGRVDEALGAYRGALAIDPKLSWAEVNLGTMLRDRGQLSEAVACFERACAISPDLVVAHVNLGAALLEQNDHAGALRALDRALQREPAHADAHLLVARTQEAIGNAEAAEAAAQRALKIQPSLADALPIIGRSLQARGDVAAAEATFRQALRQHPEDGLALACFVRSLIEVGKIEEARSLFDPETMVTRRWIESADGWPSIERFNEALAHFVADHPTLVAVSPENPVKGGSRTLEIFDATEGPMVVLRRYIERAVAEYVAATLPAISHPFAPAVPARWRLTGWANILSSSGYHATHCHPEGSVSGVYYVRVPKVIQAGRADEAGYFRFGHPAIGSGDAGAHPLAMSVKPEEGSLTLFPAYVWHYTVPFDSDETRISIAFDAVPVTASGGVSSGARD